MVNGTVVGGNQIPMLRLALQEHIVFSKAIFAENEGTKIVLGSINTFYMMIRDVFAILRCSLRFTDLFTILPYYSLCNTTKNGHFCHYLKSCRF